MKKLAVACLSMLLLLEGSGLSHAHAALPGLVPAPSETILTGKGYWETPMDITDTRAVWDMLMTPVTVVKGNQKTQQVLYAEPDEKSAPVGDVTRDSQGLHVLETRSDGWSLVETYSSSFFDSKVKAWNMLVRGYIRTNMLETVTPKGKYGLVVDKLDQRLYIFEDGELYDVLAVSTGLPNDQQPYNETRSGEFLLVSPMGGFEVEGLNAAMGLRFNFGDVLHEVPHLIRNGEKRYEKFEEVLGQRASHGCIRVQRKRTPKGTNMTWVWNALRKRMDTKLVVWEDLPGRQLPVPDPSTPLFYNPLGGQNYHRYADKCYGVRDKFLPLTGFTYGELTSAPFDKLTPCAYCIPARRPEDIAAINAAHALP
ncbi:MAG TPA: L,D-transpeptidase [Candidatus Limnocylindria bacterium]|nr:L,D-transpeptidase [Candidatus Limnocylindria bacterium]